MQLPTGDRFDYGLPGYLEAGVVNLLNALKVPNISEGGTALVDGGGNTYVLTPSGRIADAASRDITAADNGQSLVPTGTLTYTIPAGLSPMPSFAVDCPASGTITIAPAAARRDVIPSPAGKYRK